MEKYCVGIDVDKSTLKACLSSSGDAGHQKVLGSRTFKNAPEGFEELTEWSSKKLKGGCAMYLLEATGVYHEHLAYHLYGQKLRVHILLPTRAKRYMQSMGIRSKTDQIDAKGLSRMGLEQSLTPWRPASKKLLGLRSLTRQIEVLQGHRIAFKNQLEAAGHSAVVHSKVVSSLKQMIGSLEKQITKLKKEVEKIVESDPFLSQKYALFSTLKGVGIMSFAVVVSETDGFALFENQRQLVCYSGYDIVRNDSGQRVGKSRISKKGNTHIRRILHMAAWSAVGNKVAPFHQLYERVYERTGVKMKAYTAVQRKLLVMIYTLWKKDEAFDPTYQTSVNQEPETLFSGGPEGNEIKTAPVIAEAALDGLPCNQSPGDLFSVT